MENLVFQEIWLFWGPHRLPHRNQVAIQPKIINLSLLGCLFKPAEACSIIQPLHSVLSLGPKAPRLPKVPTPNGDCRDPDLGPPKRETQGPPGAPRAPPGPVPGPGLGAARRAHARHRYADGRVGYAHQGQSPSAPQAQGATGVPSRGHEGTLLSHIPVVSSRLRHDLATSPLRHSLRCASTPWIPQGQLPRCVTRASAPLLRSLGVRSPAPSEPSPPPPHRGVAWRGPSMPHHHAGGSLSASDTPPCGGCISPPGDPPPDPRLAGLKQLCNGCEDPVHTYFL